MVMGEVLRLGTLRAYFCSEGTHGTVTGTEKEAGHLDRVQQVFCWGPGKDAVPRGLLTQPGRVRKSMPVLRSF
jgi:hypothetical protein